MATYRPPSSTMAIHSSPPSSNHIELCELVVLVTRCWIEEVGQVGLTCVLGFLLGPFCSCGVACMATDSPPSSTMAIHSSTPSSTSSGGWLCPQRPGEEKAKQMCSHVHDRLQALVCKAAGVCINAAPMGTNPNGGLLLSELFERLFGLFQANLGHSAVPLWSIMTTLSLHGAGW